LIRIISIELGGRKRKGKEKEKKKEKEEKVEKLTINHLL